MTVGEAYEEIERILGNKWLGDDGCWALWDVDEWLSEPREYVTPEMTDENIAAEAHTLETDAENEGVILNGDVANFLMGVRDEIRAEMDQEYV